MTLQSILFASYLVLASQQDERLKEAGKQGELFGEKQATKAMKENSAFSANDLLTENQNFEDLDIDDLKQKMLQGMIPNSEIKDFISKDINGNIQTNKNFHESEAFIQTSEEISKKNSHTDKKPNKIPSNDEIKCYESGEPYPLSYVRDLQVSLTHIPKVEKIVKHCKGHEKEHKGKTLEEIQNKLIKDRSDILQYSPEVDKKIFSSYKVKEKYTHINDSKNCDNYYVNSQIIEEERWVEGPDEWLAQDENLLKLSQTPDCTFISSRCIDNAHEKIINGKAIQRQCWKEELNFRYFHPEQRSCNFLKDLKVSLIHKKCIKDTPYGCAVWELTFKLANENKDLGNIADISTFAANSTLNEEDEKKNNSFAKVLSKLFILKEVKRDLEQSEKDAKEASIFAGQKLSCSKNILENVVYDCCFCMKGLAVKANLAKCSAEELSLAERREKGLCHYVGYYSEKLLDMLWKSRDIHVFCCFPSKLAKVLQEEGRKQLGKSWGTAKEPICGGLKVAEISKLDFSKLDLSEIYEDLAQKVPLNLEERLESFQNKLKMKVEKEGDNLGKIDSTNQHY